ncbi:hypothetical protein HAX54_041708 [Datura stramonium]|uniref:Uncharacterized protein n=1 Tax=Datura stramonium TaxID=4076 RepID=A0ABS8W0D1_DATST|nr:hypothetical protein [Datura stramonium]
MKAKNLFSANAEILSANPVMNNGNFEEDMYTRANGNSGQAGPRGHGGHSGHSGQVGPSRHAGNIRHDFKLRKKGYNTSNNAAYNVTFEQQDLSQVTPHISAQVQVQDWIIDTEAINHMVADLNLLDKTVVAQVDNPRKAFLPNGDTTLDLYNGKVKVIDKENGDLYLLVWTTPKGSEKTIVNCSVNEGSSNIHKGVVEIDIWRHRRFGHASSNVTQQGPYKIPTVDGNKYSLL